MMNAPELSRGTGPSEPPEPRIVDVGSLDTSSLDVGSLDTSSLDVGSSDTGLLHGELLNGPSLDGSVLEGAALDVGPSAVGSGAALDDAHEGAGRDEPRSAAVIAGAAFAAYRGGDSNQLNELVRVTTPILWHTVRSYRLDAATAEDVLQSTWLALVRRAEHIEDPRAVLQWLIVTARREAWRVATASRRTEPWAWEGDELSAPAQDQPETIAVRSAQDRLLWEHIRGLSMRCQQLLRVIAFADRPDYEAISRALGIPVGSIGPTRGRCLAKLRASLATDATWST